MFVSDTNGSRHLSQAMSNACLFSWGEPPEASQLIFDYFHAFASVAYLSRAWLATAYGHRVDSVRGAYDCFLQSTFSVELLWMWQPYNPVRVGDRWTHVPVDERSLRIRLEKLLEGVREEDRTPEVMFWYRAQLHLHIFCAAKSPTTLKDVLLHCFKNYCSLSHWQALCYYRHSDDRHELPPENLLASPLDTALADNIRVDSLCFQDKAFLGARDLGCDAIGYSVMEVFRTMQCMMLNVEYCAIFCRSTTCAGNDGARDLGYDGPKP